MLQHLVLQFAAPLISTCQVFWFISVRRRSCGLPSHHLYYSFSLAWLSTISLLVDQDSGWYLMSWYTTLLESSSDSCFYIIWSSALCYHVQVLRIAYYCTLISVHRSCAGPLWVCRQRECNLDSHCKYPLSGKWFGHCERSYQQITSTVTGCPSQAKHKRGCPATPAHL